MKNNDIEITLKLNKYTPELKEKHLGLGEWVDEPDEVSFQYRDLQCKILRSFFEEPHCLDEHYFGGHLSGYVGIPKTHPHHITNTYNNIDIDCHGGLTFQEFGADLLNWIGFDCAHLDDYIPSVELFKRTNLEMIEFRKKFPHRDEKNYLFNPTYKNIEFCINECKSIVDQLILMENTHEMGK